MSIAPGQVCLARTDSPTQPFLRVPVYPFHTRGGLEFYLDPLRPQGGTAAASGPSVGLALEPGMALDLIGPCGRGFDLPPRAANLLLGAASPARLFPLLLAALDRGWAVAFLFTDDQTLPALPLAVEIHRASLTPELVAWADMIALDVPDPLAWAREIRAARLGPARGFIQALVAPPMPCGVGACRACWVEVGAKRRLACVHGPVFEM